VADLPDDLDGCDLDFTPDAVDDATVEMLPLFPHGDPGGQDATPADWAEVFR
jgi:hypothetical protein